MVSQQHDEPSSSAVSQQQAPSSSSTTMEKKKEKVIFVTVGTTLFSSLIDNILHYNTIEYMIQNQYTHLIIQYGKDIKPNIDHLLCYIHDNHNSNHNIQIELYDFKSSLYNDMVQANMIICHAGAGTLTEAIRISQKQQQTTQVTNPKKIITVINTLLMDNHQTELAYALQRRQLVHVINDPQQFTTTNNATWNEIDLFIPSLSTSLEGNPYDVPRIIHNFLGSTSSHCSDHVTNKDD